MRIALVGCGKSKQPHPAAACDLYTGSLFRAARGYVQAHQLPWYILSAKHGMVRPTLILAPYEQTLNKMAVKARREWALDVEVQIRHNIPPGATLVFLCGKNYREPLIQLLGDDYAFECPIEGLGLGRQIQFYRRRTP